MIQVFDMPDLLSRLIDRSLVTYDDQSCRYRLLETVRQYAAEHALNFGDSVAARATHAAYFAHLCSDAHIKVRGPDQIRWLRTFDLEYDNIRLAIEWMAGSEDHSERAVKLAYEMLGYWMIRALYNEMQHWVSRFREGGMPLSDEDECRLLLIEEAAMQFQGFMREDDLAKRAISHAEASGNERLRAEAYAVTAIRMVLRKDEAKTRAFAEQALPLLNKHGNSTMAGFLHMNLANLALSSQRWEVAREEYETALRLRRMEGDFRGVGASLGGLAEVADFQGDTDRAVRLWRFTFAIFSEVGGLWDLAGCMPGLCLEALQREKPDLAAAALGCADALQQHLGSVRDIADAALYERNSQLAQRAQPQEAFAAAYDSGFHMSWQKMMRRIFPDGLRLPSEEDLDEISGPIGRASSMG